MEFKKPYLTDRNIEEIVDNYPFGHLVTSIDLGGIPNSTFKVTTTSDKVFVIRVYGQGQSSLEHIIFEHEVLRHLEAYDFPSPKLLKAKNNEQLIQWNGYWVCATDFIKGELADKINRTPSLMRSVGKLLAMYQKIMQISKISVPNGETFIERGNYALQSLPPYILKLGINVDITNVLEQWSNASKTIIQYETKLRSGIIHADIWPPNLICDKDEVVGLTDFDDCCFGATIIDLSLALMECSMFGDTHMDHQQAYELIFGYLTHGGEITNLERAVIVDAMEMACAMWYAYNIIEAPSYQEAEIYLSRLGMFNYPDYKANFSSKLFSIISDAESAVSKSR